MAESVVLPPVNRSATYAAENRTDSVHFPKSAMSTVFDTYGLKLVMPTQNGGEERSYMCPQCKHSQNYVIES